MEGMKTHTFTPHPIAQAVLSANKGNEPLAVLTADLSTHDDGWYQLLPAGKFKAPDGRPSDTADGHWHLDADGAQAFIAATKALRDKVLVDYDHQTLYVEQTGKRAPAAAWLTASTDIEWREGQGIYIRPEWTSKAQSMIDEKEYAFLSAVFPYDKSGKPLYLRMAAITNDPGITKMESVAALAADFNVRLSKNGVDVNLYGETEDAFVNEALKKLLARLGITVDGELTDEMATAALSAIDALQTKADKIDGLETKVATLSAQDGKVDLSKFVPIDAYNGVVGELAVLKADSDQTSISSLIDTAKQDGKVVEAEMVYLTQFGEQQGVASLKAMLEARPAIAALKATQTQGKKPPQDQVKQDDLTETELAVLKATGLSKEQYLATKKEEA